jgi:hypothetical protein
MTPGKNPASTIPKKNLNATRPARFVIPFAPTLIAPQMNMRAGKKREGRERTSNMLEGTSARRYPTKKIDRARE